MKSPTGTHHREAWRKDAGPDDGLEGSPDEATAASEIPPDPDENDLDESDLQDADDDRWDVFILDDEGEPLPEYGDFWFPD